MGEVNPDLMGAAGIQFHLDLGGLIGFVDDAVMGDGRVSLR